MASPVAHPDAALMRLISSASAIGVSALIAATEQALRAGDWLGKSMSCASVGIGVMALYVQLKDLKHCANFRPPDIASFPN
jgi:hypothetical protein